MRFARPIAFIGMYVQLLALSQAALAVTASIFTVDIPQGATIERARDHYSVIFENGWLSRQNKSLWDLFSRAKSGVFNINGSVTFDDNQSLQLDSIMTLEDPKNSMGRSLGLRGPIYVDLPGDVTQLDLSLRINVVQEDRLAKLLGSLDAGKASLPAEVLSGAWLGYAKMVSVVTNSLFGTSDTDYPISGRYKASMPVKEHYVLMIASSDDNDGDLAGASSNDFTYSSQKLHFRNGAVPSRWTYFVLKIQRNPDARTVAQRALSLETPWATVIRTQLRVLPVSKAKDESQLSGIADNALTAIQNLEKFLISDRSFSNFDRATALYYYSDSAIRTISGACKDKNIAACPTGDLVQYRTQIAAAYKIDEPKLQNVAIAIDLQNSVEEGLKRGFIKPPPGQRKAPLLGLSEWEKYVEAKAVNVIGVQPTSASLQTHYLGALALVPKEATASANRMSWDPVQDATVKGWY